jgi:hypothetical protein
VRFPTQFLEGGFKESEVVGSIPQVASDIVVEAFLKVSFAENCFHKLIGVCHGW